MLLPLSGRHILLHETVGRVRVVVAPAAFKGTLTAAQAAEAIGVGVRRALPRADIVLRPIADGGDGSVDAMVSAGYEPRQVVVRGPTRSLRLATIATQGSTAVAELANTCGLSVLPGRVLAPMTASTHGLGDAIRAALDAGADDIVVCLGGSASTDGGAGMLIALGAHVNDRDGNDVAPGGVGLRDVAALDLAALDPRIRSTRFTVAADVTSPLRGPDGAAHVFGPQKGASTDDVAMLDAGLRNWSAVLTAATGHDVADRPGAGAAGGTAAAALAVLGADLVSGSDYIHAAIGLADAVADADLVVTGEGRLDAQSLLGKGPVAVARLATAADVPVVAVCGQITLTAKELTSAGFAAWSSIVG